MTVNFSQVDSTTTIRSAVDAPATPAGSEAERAAMRKVASEFESMMLAQMTKSMNPSSDDEDADMFRSDANDMYRTMYSEQLARTLSENGGVGLADTILVQIEGRRAPVKTNAANGTNGIERAFAAARDLRNDHNSAQPAASSARSVNNSSAEPFVVSTAAEAEDNSWVKIREVRPSEVTDPSRLTRPRRVFATPNVTSGAQEPHAPVEPVALQMPVEGRISSGFGMRRHPVHGRHADHKGIDIAATRGTPIGAAADGTVIFSGRQGAYGNTGVIQHAGGRTTRYAHADRLMVEKGDTVNAGQTIGTVGSTGRSTGPHLHFEVMEGDRRTNPLRALANAQTLARR